MVESEKVQQPDWSVTFRLFKESIKGEGAEVKFLSLSLNYLKQQLSKTKLKMSRTKEDRPRVANRDRHVSRNAPWNAKPMKKSGGGKGNWGVEGEEVDDFSIPVNQVFKDIDYRDDEVIENQDNNKIRVVSRDELESENNTSSEE